MAKMGLFEKAKLVMIKPKEFFAKVKAEKGISGAFGYLALVSLIYVIGNYLVSPDIYEITAIVAWLSKEGIAVFSYAIMMLSLFISAGITHILVRLLGGTGKYYETYKAYVYGSTPSLLLGWIPIVGVLGSLYALYLSVLGVSKYHKISMWRAFVAIVLIPLLAAIIGFLAAVVAYASSVAQTAIA